MSQRSDSVRVHVCACVGGTSRASGMLLHYKPMSSQDVQQLRMEAAEDKKVASLWLAAMHKVRQTGPSNCSHRFYIEFAYIPYNSFNSFLAKTWNVSVCFFLYLILN